MNRTIQWWKTLRTRTKIIICTAIVIVIIIIVVHAKKESSATGLSAVVSKGNVLNSVVLSGTTESASAVSLGFASQGRVATVAVTEGDTVHAGEILASLDTSDLQASLKNAQAALVIAQANASNNSTDLDAVTTQQNTLVQNAYNTLLSDHLAAVPENLTVTSAPPTISGLYTGPEGQYVIHVYPSGASSGASFTISGLETGFTNQAASSTPVPLGSHGLYIQFQPGVVYGDSYWTVSIPNTESTTYASDLDAYNSALATRTQAIAAAQASVTEQQSTESVAGAEIQEAQAQVESVLAEISQREIIAPFTGVVAAVNIKPGQTTNSFNASGSTSDDSNANISLISENDYEVVLQTPEIDVASIAVGQPVSLTLNAFGPTVTFPGTITSIDPAETIVDGVPVYDTKVAFTKLDPRIRSGMTATATITIGEKDAVLMVPASFIQTDSAGNSYVYLLSGTDTIKQPVTTGLRGSDSEVEITSGLTDGQTILSTSK